MHTAKPFEISKHVVLEAYKRVKANKGAFYSVLQYLDLKLIRWAKNKYKRLKGSTIKACKLIRKVAESNPNLFPHWCRTAK